MKRVVLVDSDELSRRVAASQLRQQGSDVVEADEQQALELFRKGVEALVVWNGRDAAGVTRLLSSLEPGVPRSVWLFTASPDRGNADASSAPVPDVRRVELVGDTTSMRDLRAQVRRLARHPGLHVFVGGEVGTGKQTFARVLHAATGAGVFVHACPSRLGEFLDARFGELAELGGTLYVPSIAEVPHAEQLRLAELMHEREVRSGAPPLRLVLGVRLAHQDVLERVRREQVDATLSSRLAVSVEIVPLRRRKSDVDALARHFLEAGGGATRPRLSDQALWRLQQHEWPGNVRELRNVIEQAALAGGDVIEGAQLPAFPGEELGISFELPKNGVDFCELERVVLEQALTRSRGNQTRAASLLGLTRDQIRYRMSKFGMVRPSATRGLGDQAAE
jgi:two-component system response regulator AtoC